MVYCEWPLATNLVEARRMYERAAKAGVPTVCGLQSRFSPVIRYARDLVTEGYIGEVLATTLVGSGHLWSSETQLQYAYAFDASNGATTLTVPVAHALDALTFVLGNIENLTASMAIRRREVRVVEDGSTRAVTAPDHVAITGVLCGGAVASVFYRGGASRGENLRWEINGTKGDLVLTADIGIVQVADLRLQGGRNGAATLHEIPIPSIYTTLSATVPQGPPTNIAYLYTQFAKDLRQGTRLTPDFADARQCHTLIDTIQFAALSGIRQTVPFEHCRSGTVNS
jgi:predicted dehydrogenase